ncbi:type 1 glutamine amidotransferase domain-containing protein [Massilia cavernae]|uniref:Type 1 glutamine amidotransferase n=1 Tax=Massilia cavernae TaxID=2320864 RepID=A0A418Y8G8_9BURK|nr:type 1 glutamine amidotransferase domain-containing protein [Massilia cavernae]RJG27753.1 type 1 glutamine amidotransferase [Massilia cavernae]
MKSGHPLKGKLVGMLMTDGVEQVEYTAPREFLEQRGATVMLLAPKEKGEHVQGMNHKDKGDSFTVDQHVRDANPADLDALVLPGGSANAAKLRQSKEAIEFIRKFGQEDKPMAAICHGPLVLIDAGLAKATNLTSAADAAEELRGAGAEWVDQEVVIADRLVTSRGPKDIPAFNDALAKELMVSSQVADLGPSS